MMRTILAGLVLLVALPARAADETELRKQLVGTWENTFGGQAEGATRQIKLITPTHFTWVVYDRESRAATALAGGTWTLKDGLYREKIDFTSEGHEFLRGKEFAFTIDIDGDTWRHKISGDAEIDVDEVWKRAK